MTIRQVLRRDDADDWLGALANEDLSDARNFNGTDGVAALVPIPRGQLPPGAEVLDTIMMIMTCVEARPPTSIRTTRRSGGSQRSVAGRRAQMRR